MVKMTVAEQFKAVEDILTTGGYDDLASFISKRAEMASKRSKSTKPTKQQEANEGIKDEILELLAGGAMRSGDIAIALGEKPNRITALLTQLRKIDGKVRRDYDKKVAMFSLGVDDEYTAPEDGE